VYIGTADNPSYLGPAPLKEIAETIATSAGPSGPNDEYLFRLCDAMRVMVPGGHIDPHLTQLERLVLEYQRECATAVAVTAAAAATVSAAAAATVAVCATTSPTTLEPIAAVHRSRPVCPS